ncbi:MAG: WD40/YVTN/BNR-like repeat-containing protein, partial [Chloroflexota bacterium]
MTTIAKWLMPVLGVALLLFLVGCEDPVPVGPLSPAVLPTAARLTSLSFVDPSHGWVVAENCPGVDGSESGDCRALVYATTNGGESWSPAGRMLLVPRRVQFTDSTTGWLVGGIGKQCGSSTCPNVVMQTTDAGRTWQRTSTTSVDLIDLSFASPRDGWILGQTCSTSTNCTATLDSTDSTGQTWSNQRLPLAGHGFRLDRLNPSLGWVGGITNGQAVLISTSDGAKHWARLDTP